MTVIYLDQVLILNTLMDYLILLLTARLSGIPLCRRRYLWAALVGGVYAAAAFLPGWDFLRGIPAKLAVGILLAVISFGGERYLARLFLVMLAVSCGLAGCVLGAGLLGKNQGIFNVNITLWGLGVSAAVAYGCLSLIFRAAGRHGVRGNLIPVRVCICGRVADLTALWDSGNGLREGIFQRPVLVVSLGVLRHVLPKEVRELLTEERLQNPLDLPESLALCVPSLSSQLLPFQAVGVSEGVLLAIRVDWIEVCGERMERAYVALSPTTLGTGYGALWGGAVKEGGRHGHSLETVAKDL